MNTIVKDSRASAFAVRTLIAAPLRAQRIAAAACLPAALASVLLGILPAPCEAATRPDLRAQLERAAHFSTITVQLVDGRAVSGAFYGFLGDWGDSVDAAIRYESWRKAHPDGLPRLGESISVSLGSGDTVRRTFEGVGPTYLALGGGSAGIVNKFAFSDVTEARSDSGGPVVSWADLHGRLLDAPPVIGIGLKLGAQVAIIPRESILSVSGKNAADDNSQVVLILLVVVATVALAVVCVQQAVDDAASSASNSIGSSSSTCDSPGMMSRSYDRRFGGSNVSRGLEPWPAGETRRP